MRPVFYYLGLTVALVIVLMFFVSEHCRQVQIGYKLTKLRHDRDRLCEQQRQLDFELYQAASLESLANAAARLGVTVQPREPGTQHR